MKHDGGPAFPGMYIDEHGMREYVPGMSLRDYYIAKFAEAWVVALSRRYEQHGYTDEYAAMEANRLGELQADAMLKAREVSDE